MIQPSLFKPAWWLRSAHAQTVFSTLFRRIAPAIDHWERVELPDGDFIDTAWRGDDLPSGSPLVVLLHGLSGSHQSAYIVGLMQAFYKKGWRSVVMHLRGASTEPNRHARAYHSGDTLDFDYFIKHISARDPHSPKAAVGFSLGGNVLLKWLGEQDGQAGLQAAVAVSVPFELRLVADRLNRGFSRLYQRRFIAQLHNTFNNKKAHLNLELLTRAQAEALTDMERWDCFWTFDDKVTAPLNGFSDVHAYYRQASSKQYLKKITTETLIIQAQDDPFMSPEVLPKAQDLSDFVTLELSPCGGHVGFIGSNWPGKPVYWLESRIPEFLHAVFIG